MRRTVLVVEDDDDIRRMFRTALSFAGFEVLEAADGLTALHSIEQHPPAAIVLDLGLPRVSGYLVLQDVIAQAHTRDIPVIIVTAQPGVEQPPGAACLLRKPVTPDQLVNTVRACIIAGGANARR